MDRVTDSSNILEHKRLGTAEPIRQITQNFGIKRSVCHSNCDELVHTVSTDQKRELIAQAYPNVDANGFSYCNNDTFLCAEQDKAQIGRLCAPNNDRNSLYCHVSTFQV